MNFEVNKNEIKSSTRFCHYTDIDSARKILSTGTILLSRFNQMNDKTEANSHEDEDNLIYTTCFCHSQAKSIPMFYIYSGIDGKGCRIEFTDAKIRKILNSGAVYPVNSHLVCLAKEFNHEDYEVFADWIYYKSSDSIGYFKGKIKQSEEIGKILKKDWMKYFIKSSYWKYENEFRIIVKFKKDPKREKIAIKFPITSLEKGISVFCGPELEDNEFNDLRKEFNEYGITRFDRFDTAKIKMRLVEKNRRLLKVN